MGLETTHLFYTLRRTLRPPTDTLLPIRERLNEHPDSSYTVPMTPPNKITPPAEPLNPLVLSVGVVFLWGAAALSPAAYDRTLVALAAALVVLVGAVLLATDPQVRRSTLPGTVWLTVLPVSVLALRAIAGPHPEISMLGTHQFRQGIAVWAIAWGWFALAALGSSPRSTHNLTRSIALLGALSALYAVGQWVGILPTTSVWSPEPSGPLCDSNELAQFLLLAAGCSLAWYIGGNGRARVAAAASGAAIIVGLAATHTRGAWIAAAVGALVFAILQARRLTPVTRRAALAALSGTIAILAVACLVVSSGVLGSSAFGALDSVLNGRAAIWHSAISQWLASPTLGEGHLAFSTYYAWAPNASRIGGIDTIGTFSPHNIVLLWLLGAGVLGLAALGLGVWAALWRPLSRLTHEPMGPAAALMAGLAGWGVAQLGEISAVTPLPVATALAGALLAWSLRSSDTALATPRVLKVAALPVGAITGAISLLVIVGLGGALMIEVPYARSGGSAGSDATTARLLTERTGDPTYAVSELEELLAYTQQEYPVALALDAQMLADALAADSEWHVDAARLSALGYALDSPENRQGDVPRALESGRAADGESPVWDYLDESIGR